jgi:transcription elongation factor Elf1
MKMNDKISGKFLTCPYCGKEIATTMYVTTTLYIIECEKCGTILEGELFSD